MAHVKKYTRAALGHMFAHFERAKNENGEYAKFGNQDIDLKRTHLNYNLAAELQPSSQGAFVAKRCSEVRMLNRKNTNVMCSWVVTAPKDLPQEEHKSFFEATFDFLNRRYGAENVVSAYVHMDETQPHMHYAFVPIVADRKRGGFKVSAKEAVDIADLRSFHLQLDRHLEAALGHPVSVLNDATKEGNKTVAQLKQESLRRETAALKAENEALRRSNSRFKRSERETANPNALKPSKSLTGGVKGISYDEVMGLIASNKRLSAEKADLENRLDAANREIARYKRQAPTTEERLASEARNARNRRKAAAFDNLSAEKQNELLKKEKSSFQPAKIDQSL